MKKKTWDRKICNSKLHGVSQTKPNTIANIVKFKIALKVRSKTEQCNFFSLLPNERPVLLYTQSRSSQAWDSSHEFAWTLGW
jgi:hypothetical protein